MKYISTKVMDGYSTCFRQWKAVNTHCSKLHGYGVSVKFHFEAKTLDDRNWVVDFGFFKRAKSTIDGMKPKDWLSWLLDHTVIMASDDPHLEEFKVLNDLGVLKLRVIPDVGCEKLQNLYIIKYRRA
jgi:6-pyruvoyltetrahydropterin/6-carboxytetrahydropterin synthase